MEQNIQQGYHNNEEVQLRPAIFQVGLLPNDKSSGHTANDEFNHKNDENDQVYIVDGVLDLVHFIIDLLPHIVGINDEHYGLDTDEDHDDMVK